MQNPGVAIVPHGGSVQAVTVTVSNPSYTLPAYADQCISTMYSHSGNWTSSIPSYIMQFVPSSQTCIIAVATGYPGGCAALPAPDLTKVLTCVDVDAALACGKTTPAAFKNYLLSRQLSGRMFSG